MSLCDVDQLEFWRLEMLLDNHKDAVEEENRKNKTQQEAQKTPDMSKMMGDMTKSMGGLGSGGGFSMPSLPKF
jgi:hypothetical protein